MNTAFALMAVHDAAVLPLDEVCVKYLGCSPAVARRRAQLNELPFPTFRLSESQKAPIFVRVSDLAEYIDNSAERARERWGHAQVSA